MMDAAGSNRWEGNYWDEYRGLDMDGDGLGDAPFATGDPLGLLLSDHPQLRLFSFSPAVQALGAAERAFPLLELPELRDQRPAMAPVALAAPHGPGAAQGPRPLLIALALGMLLGAGALLALARRPERQGATPRPLRVPWQPARQRGKARRRAWAGLSGAPVGADEGQEAALVPEACHD
jgi:hypothetical protein